MNILNIPVADIMTTEVVSVRPSQKLVDVKHIFEKEKFHHHIPVIENGELKGMISLVDFLFAIQPASLDDNEKVYHDLSAGNIMSLNPVTVSISSSLEDVCLVLAKGDVHAVIISENDIVKGIISTADVINYFLKKNRK